MNIFQLAEIGTLMDSRFGWGRAVIYHREHLTYVTNPDNTMIIFIKNVDYAGSEIVAACNDIEGAKTIKKCGDRLMTDCAMPDNQDWNVNITIPAHIRDFEDISKLHDKYYGTFDPFFSLTFKTIMGLNESLSHVEMENEESIKLTQRDIYQGKVITYTPLKKSLIEGQKFDRISLRTKDLMSLAFMGETMKQDLSGLQFGVFDGYVLIKDTGNITHTVMAQCLYDEMSKIDSKT